LVCGLSLAGSHHLFPAGRQAESAETRPGSLALGMAFPLVFFHNGPSGHFFCAFAVAPGTLRGFLNVLVLSLFFLADSPQMFLSWHNFLPWLSVGESLATFMPCAERTARANKSPVILSCSRIHPRCLAEEGLATCKGCSQFAFELQRLLRAPVHLQRSDA